MPDTCRMRTRHCSGQSPPPPDPHLHPLHCCAELSSRRCVSHCLGTQAHQCSHKAAPGASSGRRPWSERGRKGQDALVGVDDDLGNSRLRLKPQGERGGLGRGPGMRESARGDSNVENEPPAPGVAGAGQRRRTLRSWSSGCSSARPGGRPWRPPSSTRRRVRCPGQLASFWSPSWPG